jgi:pyruvate formate lyase activating enzyme
MMVNYAGKVDLSTVDWFGHGAYVIFLNGCPLKCPNCHNAQLRNAVNMVDFEDVKSGIFDSWPMVNHVVISGGEPSCQLSACLRIIDYCHSLDIKVGIETSGCGPIASGVDMVFLDIKTSLERGLYDSYTGFPGSFDSLMSNLFKLAPSHAEIRMVLFPESKFDIKTMGALLGFPVRISIGKGSGNGVVSQAGLREFGFELYEELDYSSAKIEQGRMLICP